MYNIHAKRKGTPGAWIMNPPRSPARRPLARRAPRRRPKDGRATFGEAIRLPTWLWWVLAAFYVLGFLYFLVIATLAFLLPSKGCQC